MPALTPLLKQYREIKSKFRDAILLFRVGDFYETFYEDAKTTSKVLNITLTSRPHGKNNRIPLAGVPVKAADGYIAKLVRAGYRVAVCEQLEEPQKGKAVVKRDVVEVITPGTVLRPSLLEGKRNIFIMSVLRDGESWAVAFSDVSTGEFQAGFTDNLKSMISRLEPSEILLTYGEKIDTEVVQTPLPPEIFDPDFASEELKSHFNVQTLDPLGLDKPSLASVSGALLWYLRDTQKTDLFHIRTIKRFLPEKYMYLDTATIRNLELIRRVNGDYEGSLLHTIDRTVTSMGGRRLKNNILYPLKSIEKIRERIEIVEAFFSNPRLVENVREKLKEVSDIERISGRIATGRATPRDLKALSTTLRAVYDIFRLIDDSGSDVLKCLVEEKPDMELVEKIDNTIVEDPPATYTDGGIIKDGVNEELDELRSISRDGKRYLIEYEKKERERTGISSLKVGFNNVFGYYIEVTKPNLKYVPDDYIRKQTLTNSERFITEELKEFESKILGAEERIKGIEYDIFTALREYLKKHIPHLQRVAEEITSIDLFSSLAYLGLEKGYSKPYVYDGDTIEIKGGRHPVVETILPSGEFIPNDTDINQEERIHIITGPNMSGKSTYLRQVALITLLAQIGSFVPADEARIGVRDRIFTRIGASDDLARGVSTFLAEMNETAIILQNVSSRSLVILDEIGRGTSTYDGLAIAWAVVEYLAAMNPPPMVLFATHYHELTDLEQYYNTIVNYTVDVKETENGILFLRKVKKGKADRSYGIEVAKLAGLPDKVIHRAGEILHDLEKDDRVVRHHPPRYCHLPLFREKREDKLREELKKIDPDSVTPRQALEILYKLKEMEED